MIKVDVAQQFSRTPGARHPSEGPFSGEEFRNELLAGAIDRAKAESGELEVNLDGTEGYATSFLEEAFGGLVREGVVEESWLRTNLRIVSEEEPYLITTVFGYITKAGEIQKGSR